MTGTPTPDTPGDVTQPLDGAAEVTPDAGPGAETTSEKLEKSNRRFTTWRRQRAFGAGLGVRYATAIGPIRADVAFPLKKLPGDSGYGLYIGIGQAF